MVSGELMFSTPPVTQCSSMKARPNTSSAIAIESAARSDAEEAPKNGVVVSR